MFMFSASLKSKDFKGNSKWRTIVIKARDFNEAYEQVEKKQEKNEVLIDLKIKNGAKI